MSRQTIARTKKSRFEAIPQDGIESCGASYSHLVRFGDAIGPSTKSMIAQHTFLDSLEGLENATCIDKAYLAFCRLKKFRPQDARIKVNVLDLGGNPLQSLEYCPIAKELMVPSTLITDLRGAPEGIQIIRCGHSTHLKSLIGCPSSVKLIECSCTPNLVIEREHLPKGLEELITDDVSFVL